MLLKFVQSEWSQRNSVRIAHNLISVPWLPEKSPLGWRRAVDWHSAAWVIITPGIDSGAYRETPHLRRIERHKKVCELLDVLGARISQRLYFALSACVPEKATTDELVRVTLRFIDEHPEYLSGAAADVVWRAIVTSYPCPAK